MLPTCRTTTRLETFFIGGGFKRQPGFELAGWGIDAVSPDNIVRIFFGPVTCDAGHPAFFGAAAMTPLNSLGLLNLSDGLILSSPVVNVFAFCMTRNTLLRSLWKSFDPSLVDWASSSLPRC